MQIRLSTVDEMLACEDGLFGEHWQEVAGFKKLMILAPDEECYRAAEAAGQLIVLAAFEGSTVVGYSVSIIKAHLHYRDLTVAVNDVLFLTPAMRSRGNGDALIAATEQHARERGAKLLFWHAKLNTALDIMLPRKHGYVLHEHIYAKEL